MIVISADTPTIIKVFDFFISISSALSLIGIRFVFLRAVTTPLYKRSVRAEFSEALIKLKGTRSGKNKSRTASLGIPV